VYQDRNPNLWFSNSLCDQMKRALTNLGQAPAAELQGAGAQASNIAATDAVFASMARQSSNAERPDLG
jgi:hypothetical protein